MSDPMTKVEIEDVLSSIRRLVSEDLTIPQGVVATRDASRPAVAHPRPMLSAAPAPQPEQPEMAGPSAEAEEDALDASLVAELPPQQPGKTEEQPLEAGVSDIQLEADAAAQPDPLVLTPALRVARPDSASLRASLEETIAELEAAISGSGGDWEPDGSEMPQVSDEFEDFADDLAAAISRPLDEDEMTEGAPVAQRGAAVDDLAEGDAEPQDAEPPRVERQDVEPETDIAETAAEGSVRLVSDTGDARPEGLWSQYPETMEWAAPGDMTEDDPEGQVVDGVEEPRGEGLELAPEEPEDLPGEADAEPNAYADPEPELADRFWAAEAEDMASPETVLHVDEADAPKAEAPDWQDDPVPDNQPRRLHLAGGLGWGATPPISAAGRGWLRGEPEETDLLEAEEDDEDGLFDDVEETVLDEAALRALVSEIIRQELQGTLGERITRSVRKLVRREIQRALASRDFE
ncbi:hypothetical protein [Frigidibacter sp.]|uniref:hypothetical protein n=1 Tax=Frigidibacter sp. TaxID=2586418 RepID=UPI0027339C90|nr:hypothetical protein [Frigidibacter sp.]MDP3338731.1 hypothetical protein [Frigidibacter sp.]